MRLLPWIAAGAVLLLAPQVLRCGEADTVTYHKDIAPILERHCLGCHRDGAAAVLPLATYPQVRALALNINSSVRFRRMPHNSKIQDPARVVMVERDLATLLAWIEDGMAEGKAAEPKRPDTKGQPGARLMVVSR